MDVFLDWWKPIADLWDANCFVRDWLSERLA